MGVLIEWWYRFGQGPNIRALILFGLFGGLQWLLMGVLCGKAFSCLFSRIEDAMKKK